MRAKQRLFRGAVMLLMLLMIVPCAAHGEVNMQTYSLTRLFGMRSVRTVLVFNADTICVMGIEKADTGNEYTLTFADVARERILGEARFMRSGYLRSFKAQDENVRLTFEQYMEESDDALWEEVIVAPNGGLTSRSFLPEEKEGFPMPDGGWIVEQDANLYLREAGADTLQTLLTGVPFDWDSENTLATLTYHFFQALDGHRFVYERMGWEWSSGYGVYDLRTGKDQLLDKSGAPCLIYAGKLFATTAVVDLNTYEKKALPKAIQEIMNGIEGIDDAWALSPDGQTLCVLIAPYDGDASLEFYQIISGKRLAAIPLEAGYWELIGYSQVGIVGLYAYSYESQEELVCICSIAGI